MMEIYFLVLKKVIQIVIILPVSSLNPERSFSTVWRIKIWLRSCMDRDRFNNYLSILSIKHDININNEDIWNIFEKTEIRIQFIILKILKTYKKYTKNVMLLLRLILFCIFGMSKNKNKCLILSTKILLEW